MLTENGFDSSKSIGVFSSERLPSETVVPFSAAHLRRDIPIKGAATEAERWSPTSRFREQRLRLFLLPLLESLAAGQKPVRILDIGGAVPYWLPIADTLQRLDCQITLTNLTQTVAVLDGAPDLFTFAIGDGRNLAYPNASFDLIHSNSVIEHVGSWLDMRAMAHEIRRLAPSYYVQTPNFWFPYEPHYRKPFFHWLPEQVRARWMMRKPFKMWPKAPSLIEAAEWVQRARLLDHQQLAALFPDATIRRERFKGLTKSLVAIKHDC